MPTMTEGRKGEGRGEVGSGLQGLRVVFAGSTVFVCPEERVFLFSFVWCVSGTPM